jgi:3-oxoacyl-[acyl-carrier-protein] synthase-1
MVAPSGEGAVRCIQQALAQAGMLTVDYINTHGTSTPLGDITELDAIATALNDPHQTPYSTELLNNQKHSRPNSDLPPISSTKSMTGHSLGAVGAQELIYCLLMMREGFIAPSINIETLDDGAKDFDIVTQTREADLQTIMTNSFGFGGTNATLIIKKFEA